MIMGFFSSIIISKLLVIFKPKNLFNFLIFFYILIKVKIKKNQMIFTDKRSKNLSDYITGIKLIKYYGTNFFNFC